MIKAKHHTNEKNNSKQSIELCTLLPASCWGFSRVDSQIEEKNKSIYRTGITRKLDLSATEHMQTTKDNFQVCK